MKTKLIILFQLIIIVTLLVSVIGKLQSTTAATMFLYKLIGTKEYIETITIMSIMAEFVIMLVILSGMLQKQIYFLTGLMFGAFSILMAVALIKGITGNCGCFGNIFTSELGIISILRNVVLTLMSFYLHKNRDNTLSVLKYLEKKQIV